MYDKGQELTLAPTNKDKHTEESKISIIIEHLFIHRHFYSNKI